MFMPVFNKDANKNQPFIFFQINQSADIFNTLPTRCGEIEWERESSPRPRTTTKQDVSAIVVVFAFAVLGVPVSLVAVYLRRGGWLSE